MTEKNLTDLVSWAMNLGAAPFTVLAVVAFCYILRLVPFFPNRWIPISCVVIGTVMFPILAHHHTDDTTFAFLVRTIFMGAIIGAGAWVFHNKLIKQIEDKIPLLGAALSATQEKAENQQNTNKL
jgi:peptidoglycan/LPS O-acetylase OafA/YrhL